MNTLRKIGLAAALLVIAATNVARADGDKDPEIVGFRTACYAHIKSAFCDDGAATAAPPAAAPTPDPKVAALAGEVTALKAVVSAMQKPKPVAKRAAPAGPTLRSRIANLEVAIAKLEGKPPSDPGESYADQRGEADDISDDLAELRRELADETEGRINADSGHNDNNAAQSARMDEHDRRLLDLHRRLDRLADRARPIEFALYAAPLLLQSGDGTDISYFGLAPQLLIPIWGDTSLEFEAGLLLGDDENPFGTFSRAGVAYRVGDRVHIVGGIGLLMAGIGDRLKAESASVLGTAGMRFGIGSVRLLDFGFDIMMGNELDRDGHEEPIMGVRGLVGIRLPD